MPQTQNDMKNILRTVEMMGVAKKDTHVLQDVGFDELVEKSKAL